MSDENINICINVVTKKSIREAGDQLDRLGQTGVNAGKKIKESMQGAETASKLLRNSGIALTAGLVALTAAAVKSLNVFKQFESGLINVEKVTNFSGKQLGQFGKEIDLLARRIPVGTSELLNMAQTAGQLGIEGARNILQFTETVALLTKTTDLTVDSAQKLAQLLAVSNTSAKDIGRLGAVIVDLGNNFSATESQILEVSTRIAQSSTQFNLLAEDSVKLGAVIAGVGEKAEASGTAIGKSFRALNSAIEQGGAPLQQLIDLTGLQREELRKLFAEDPAGLLRKFAQGLAGAKDQGKLVTDVLGDLGLSSDRVLRVLGPLIKNTDQVKEAFDRTSVQMEKQNALAEEAAKQFRSLASQEAFATNATTELAKTFGQLLEPAYRVVLSVITETATAITDFVIENEKLIKVISVGAVTVVAGLTAIGIAVFATSTAFDKLAASVIFAWSSVLVPLIPIIAGLTALGLAVSATVVYWDELKLVIMEVNAIILDFVADVLDVFSQLETGIKFITGLFLTEWVKAFDLVTGALSGLIKAMDLAFGTNISEQVEKFSKSVKQTAEELKNTKTESSEAANSIRDFTKSIREDIQAEIDARTAMQARVDAIKELKKEQEELRNIERETGIVRTREQDLRLKQIQSELDELSGLAEKKRAIQKEADDKAKADKVAQLIEVARIEAEFAQKFKALNDANLQSNTQGIRDQLNKQLADQIKSQRDKLIETGNFIEARQAQITLDRLTQEQQEIAELEKAKQRTLDAERAKIEALDEIRDERKELEVQELELEAEIKIEKDATELSNLRTRLQEIQLIKLEGQELEAELEEKHEERLRIIREKNAKKRERVLINRSNKEIINKKAFNAVQVELDKTTAQAVTDIGDNLFKAGIIRGKRAGKVLKTIKTGEAIVNTFAGANLALSKFPGPVGILAAAGVVATGLANVATIQSQKFATGGIVQPTTSGSRGIDNVPALLSVGEEVLTANNPRHRDNISRESDTALLEAINGLRGDIQGMQMSVNIDGKEVADVIQEQRFRGVN